MQDRNTHTHNPPIKNTHRRASPQLLKQYQALPLDDHSKVAPLLPIPNRTVKRLCADDSGCTSVKVGHRQAPYP